MKKKILVTTLVAVGLALAKWASAQTVVTTIHTFPENSNSVAFPTSALFRASDGNFYGTTDEGGNGAWCGLSIGCGTIYRITPAGTLTTLYNFCSLPGCADGAFPYKAALVQSIDGDLYGTTYDGGASTFCGPYGCGSIFKITTNGVLTTLHSFCLETGCPDGQFPGAALVQGSDGNFYGTTESGGANNSSLCWATNGTTVGCGTVFKMTPDGVLSTLHSFCSTVNAQGLCADGYYPEAALVEGSGGDLYGTTSGGGAYQQGVTAGGTVFRITTSGKLTILHAFCVMTGCADGSNPYAKLTQVGEGLFYGTTSAGGTGKSSSPAMCSGCGTLFKITSAGEFANIHSFCSQPGCADGRGPVAGLVEGRNGDLYGTTQYGGLRSDGNIFVTTTAGELTTLHKFCAKTACADGTWPGVELLQAADGSFYGTTGGVATVFHLSGSTLFPVSATFPKQTVGTTSPAKIFTLKNKEGVSLGGFVVSTTGDFAVSSTTCAATLAVGVSCTINVTFMPTQTGVRKGQLSITDNANNSPQISMLTGTGV